MGLTGFDPSIVNQSISAVKTAYESLIQALGNDMQTKFIGGMSDKWACKEAQTFFNSSFKPAIDSLIVGSNRTFQSVADTMNAAANEWARLTGAAYTPKQFTVTEKSMDTSSILENIGGVRGCDAVAAKEVATQLPQIAESAKSALTAAQQAVQNCGFVGGNQEANLIQSLTQIKTNIDNATQEISTQTKEAINQTADAYQTIEGEISRAFAGQN